MASGMLSFGQSDISNKLSISTQMFIDERDGALELKRNVDAEKRLGLEFVGKRLKANKNDDRIYAAPDTIDGRAYISAFIRMDNNADVKMLNSKGVIIQSSFDNGLYTALIPVSRIEEVARLSNVKRINVSMLMRPFTNNARSASNVDDVLTKSADAVALGLSQKYDGTGVVLGVIDTGIDFQHIAFKDANGNSRIKRAYVYNGSRASEYSTISSSSPTTDDSSEDHGTHTSSTAGGSSVIISGNNVTVTNDHANATYGGMAPGADLYLAGINGLSSTYMANAFQKICNYADGVGKPVVISNSWGSQYGPHDGTGDFADITAQYFGSNHPNHICLFAASNDAGKSKDGEGGGYHVSGTASSSSPLGSILRAASYSNTDAGYYYYGIIANAWSRSSLGSGSLACKIFVLDSSTGAVKTSVTVTPSTSGSTVSGLSSYFSGTLYAYKDYVSSNKSQIMLYTSGLTSRSYTTTTKNGSTYYKSKYTLAVQFYPTSGSCTIDAWGGSYGYFTNYLSTSGYTWTNGSDNSSVSDEATDPNVIAIGAYVTKNSVTDYNGSTHSLSSTYTLGDIAYFSSYQESGQGPTGNMVPWISAPGATIASAVNHYHTSDSYIDNSYADYGMYRVNSNTTNPYGTMEGTSMATPAAAGIVALWLQAATEAGKTLTNADVKTIMQQTAITDSYTRGTNGSHFGHGKIDALAGIQQILGSTPGQVVTTPVITASASSLSFSANAGETQTKSVTISGSDLTGDITVAVSGSAFSVNTTSISATQAAAGKAVNVTFTAPATAGSYSGALTLTSASAAAVTIALAGTSVAQQQPDPDPEPTTTKEVYKLVSSVTSGKQYMIVNSNDVGAANAIATNASHTVTNSSISIKSGDDGNGNTIKYIEEPSSYALWTCGTSSSSKTFKNGSYYLYHKNNKLSMNTSTSYAKWTVGSSATSLYYSSGGNKYLAYSSSWTITSTSSKVYFYEKTTITVPGEGGGDDPVVPDPALSVSKSSLSFSTEEGTPVSQTFTLTGANLTQNVSVSLTGGNGAFTVSPSTISASAAQAGATITVTFNPASAGNYNGSVTFTSGSASASVTLSGSATAAPEPEPEPAGGTASDSYLNLHKYSTISDAGYSGVNALYAYTEKSDGSAWITVPAYGAYSSSSYQGWISYSSNSTVRTTWSSYDVFKGYSNWFSKSSSSRAITSSSSGTATQNYFVSNLTAVKVYGYNPSSWFSSPSTTINVYECTVSSNGSVSASSSAVATGSYSTAGNSFVITLDNLDASKVYKVVVSVKKSYFYEIAFQTTQSAIDGNSNFNDWGTLGIGTINTDEDETRIFTIHGQYVGSDIQSLEKGMYIINGKKVMIK